LRFLTDFKFDLFQPPTHVLIVLSQSFVVLLQPFIFELKQFYLIPVFVEDIFVFILVASEGGIVHIFDGKRFFLFGSLDRLAFIVEAGYLEYGFFSFIETLLESETIFFVVFVEVDADFGQGFLGPSEAVTHFDRVVAVAFVGVALDAAFD
jgi:hypothetical protein